MSDKILIVNLNEEDWPIKIRTETIGQLGWELNSDTRLAKNRATIVRINSEQRIIIEEVPQWKTPEK